MKITYSLLIGLIILIAGCSEGYDVSKTVFIYGYDFTPYTAKGFLFTPESYNGDYDAVGLIELAIYPAVKFNEKEKKYTSWYPEKRWSVGDVSANEVLDSLYKFTRRMGADAVVRLKIDEAEPKTNGDIIVNGIKASGFAIKRK